MVLVHSFYIFSDKLVEIKKVRQELTEKGVELPPLKPDSAHFDSNCITPV